MTDDMGPLVELVITAPEPYGAVLAHYTRCRMTLGVLVQMVAQAQRHIIIASPFLQPGQGLSGGVLADTLHNALRRGVDVDIVSTGQSLQVLNVVQMRQDARGIIRLFQPQANIAHPQRLGSHAKFCVADGEQGYVGSANFTGPGLSEHFEMGLLVRGDVARQIEDFWMYSIQIGLFVPIQ